MKNSHDHKIFPGWEVALSYSVFLVQCLTLGCTPVYPAINSDAKSSSGSYLSGLLANYLKLYSAI